MKSHLLLFDLLQVISFADFHLPFFSLLVAVLQGGLFSRTKQLFLPCYSEPVHAKGHFSVLCNPVTIHSGTIERDHLET